MRQHHDRASQHYASFDKSSYNLVEIMRLGAVGAFDYFNGANVGVHWVIADDRR